MNIQLLIKIVSEHDNKLIVQTETPDFPSGAAPGASCGAAREESHHVRNLPIRRLFPECDRSIPPVGVTVSANTITSDR